MNRIMKVLFVVTFKNIDKNNDKTNYNIFRSYLHFFLQNYQQKNAGI